MLTDEQRAELFDLALDYADAMNCGRQALVNQRENALTAYIDSLLRAATDAAVERCMAALKERAEGLRNEAIERGDQMLDWTADETTECLTIVRALKSAPQQSSEGWLPIASAPKDGTAILVSNPTRGGCWVAKYTGAYQSGYVPMNHWFSLMLNHDFHAHQSETMFPTHWQPLPQPPKEAA